MLIAMLLSPFPFHPPNVTKLLVLHLQQLKHPLFEPFNVNELLVLAVQLLFDINHLLLA